MCFFLQPCKVLETDHEGSKMLCRMPYVRLHGILMKKLKNGESGKIDGTQGTGVATYATTDGSVHADIYIILKMDGIHLNISAVHPSIKVQFALNPVVLCQSDVLTFELNSVSTITIQVQCA